MHFFLYRLRLFIYVHMFIVLSVISNPQFCKTVCSTMYCMAFEIPKIALTSTSIFFKDQVFAFRVFDMHDVYFKIDKNKVLNPLICLHSPIFVLKSHQHRDIAQMYPKYPRSYH